MEVDTLIHVIEQDIENGKIRLNTAVEKEKIASNWNIGKHIQEHISLHKTKTGYGQSLFRALSKQLSIGERFLYLTVQFYNCYPDFETVKPGQLTWNHYKTLVTVKSPEQREVYEKIIIDKQLSTREFIALVKDDKAIVSLKGNTLKVFSGIPYLYRSIVKQGTFYLDLGFHTYVDYFHDDLVHFNRRKSIQVTKEGNTYTLYEKSYDDSCLYTYKAYVTKIVDGDTVKVDIDLGFHIVTNQTLRLRGINAFELTTRKGRKAKKFVRDALSECDCIVIKTYHRDKYSRFLADVYFSESETDLALILSNGRFLNQELLNNEFAVKYYRY